MGRGSDYLEDAQGKRKNAEWEIMPKKAATEEERGSM